MQHEAHFYIFGNKENQMFIALFGYKFFPFNCPSKWQLRSGTLGKSKVAQDGSEKKTTYASWVFCSKNMANLEALGWNITSNINLLNF